MSNRKLIALAVCALFALALASGCKKKKTSGPAPLKVENKPTLKLKPEKGLIATSPIATLLPRNTSVVFSFTSIARLYSAVDMATLSKQHKAFFQKETKEDAYDSSSLADIKAAGIDVNGPLTFVEVPGFDKVNVVVLKLRDANALKARLKKKFPTAPETKLGNATLITAPTKITMLLAGWLIEISTKKAQTAKGMLVARMLSAVKPAASLSSNPIYRQVKKRLNYGKDLFVFVNAPQLIKAGGTMKGSNPFSGFVKEMGGLGIGANLLKNSVQAKFFFGIPQAGPLKGVFKVGSPAIGTSVISNRPGLGFRVQLDVPTLIKQVMAMTKKMGVPGVDKISKKPLPGGKNPLELLNMLDGKVEVYGNLSPKIASDKSAFEVTLLIKLTDAVGVGAVLDAAIKLAGSAVKSGKTAGKTWYSLATPINKTIYFGVLQSHIVVTTQKPVIERLANGKKASFVDSFKDSRLKTMFRGNDAAFLFLDMAALSSLAMLDNRSGKLNPEDAAYSAVFKQFGLFSVAIDDVSDGISGPMILSLSSPTIAAWVQKMVPLFKAVDAVKKKNAPGTTKKP